MWAEVIAHRKLRAVCVGMAAETWTHSQVKACVCERDFLSVVVSA